MRDYTTSYVPPNIGQAGGIFQGYFKTRNAVEAAIISVPIAILGLKILPKVLPWTPCLVGTLIAIALLGGLALIGIRGISLSEWLLDFISFHLTKCYVTLGMPMPEHEKQKKMLKEKAKEREEKPKKEKKSRGKKNK